MKYTIIITKDKTKITNEFIDDDTKSRFYGSLNQWITDIYLYLIENKIVAFSTLMKENLKFGFLDYHIKDEQKEYFINNYPIINQKTNQICYLYVSKNFRNLNIATQLLDFIFTDLKQRAYVYVWLIKETQSNIYNKFDFKSFVKMLESLQIKKKFLEDYKSKCKHDEEKLNNYYGDQRVVKKL